MNNNLEIICQFKDKAFIYNILCIRTSTFYNRIKNFVQFPIILINSVMAIFNATFEANDMKVSNIVLNSVVAFFMNLIATYQITERASRYKNLSQKWSQLLHMIEDKINNNNLENDDIRDIVRIYDDYLQMSSDDIPQYICDDVKKQFQGKYMPVILQDSNSSPSRTRPPSRTDNTVIICDLQGSRL